MQTGPAGFGGYIAEQETRPAQSVTVDWGGGAVPLDGVSEFTVERQLTTDAPEATRLVTGSVSASAVITLEGNDDADCNPSKTMAWKYSPVNADSPLANVDRVGRRVALRAGLRTPDGLMDVPLFTGLTRINTVDIPNNRVTWPAQDDWESLRGTVKLPWAVNEPAMADDSPRNGKQLPGLNSQWVIDECLRQNGVHTSPPPWTGGRCKLMIPMHGSLLPATGYGQLEESGQMLNQGRTSYDIVGYDRPEFRPGKHGLACFVGGTALHSSGTADPGPFAGTYRGAVFGQYRIGEGTNVNTGTHLGAEAYVYVPPGQGNNGKFSIELNSIGGTRSATLVQFFFGNDSWLPPGGNVVGMKVNREGMSTSTLVSHDGPVLPTAAGWHYVGWAIDFTATGYIPTYNVDGIIVVGAEVACAAPTAKQRDFPRVEVAVTHQIGVESVQMGLGPNTGDIGHHPWTAQADLDAGYNEMTWLPDVDGQIGADVIREIVSAEYGTAEFTEGGRFVFRNRDRWTVIPATPAVILDSKTSVYDLQIEEALDQVRNEITGRAHEGVLSPMRYVWVSEEVVKLPPRRTTEIVVELDAPAIGWDYQAVGLDGAIGTSYVDLSSPQSSRPVAFAVRRAANGNSDDALMNLHFKVYGDIRVISPTTVVIKLKNTTSYTLYTVNPGPDIVQSGTFVKGGPALALVGRTFTEAAPRLVEVRDQTSVDRYQAQPHEMPDTHWNQDETSMVRVMSSLLKSLKSVRPILHDVEIAPDHRLQLGDYVTLRHAEVGMDHPYWVIGTRLTARADGHSMWVTLRSGAPKVGWILGRVGRSELGLTTRI